MREIRIRIWPLSKGKFDVMFTRMGNTTTTDGLTLRGLLQCISKYVAEMVSE